MAWGNGHSCADANGNPAPGPKFAYKLKWLERLIAHAEELRKAKLPAILVGDYNVMPADIDVYKPERWIDDALFRPEVRAAFHRLVALGWTDALRHLHPDERIYTFWDYLRNAWARDAGLRSSGRRHTGRGKSDNETAECDAGREAARRA